MGAHQSPNTLSYEWLICQEHLQRPNCQVEGVVEAGDVHRNGGGPMLGRSAGWFEEGGEGSGRESQVRGEYNAVEGVVEVGDVHRVSGRPVLGRSAG
jgi:hypothetical protein